MTAGGSALPAAFTNDSLTNTVRWSCARVAGEAELVTVNLDSIQDYAATFPVDVAKQGAADDRLDGDGMDNPERAIALTLASVAVNFTSGWHDIMPKRPGLSGAVSTVTRLTDYEQSVGRFSPSALIAFTPALASQVFEIPLDGSTPDALALGDLVGLLSATLNELGQLAGDHGGFENLVAAASGSADRLAGLLAPLPSFADVAVHSSGPVAFYKRAQMAAAALYRQFDGEGPGRFDDIDQLTIFADNLVPHVLRLDGLLSIDAEVERQIDTGALLPHGSAAEVEIRACGLHVVELLVKELGAAGHDVTAADVDHWLWTRGGQPTYKARRRHRCRNPYY